MAFDDRPERDPEHGRGRGPESAGTAALLMAVGAADLALRGLGSALRSAGGLLRRSDLGELADQGQRDMRTRGRLVVDRYATLPEPPLEELARRAVARQAAQQAARHDG